MHQRAERSGEVKRSDNRHSRQSHPVQSRKEICSITTQKTFLQRFKETLTFKQALFKVQCSLLSDLRFWFVLALRNTKGTYIALKGQFLRYIEQIATHYGSASKCCHKSVPDRGPAAIIQQCNWDPSATGNHVRTWVNFIGELMK
jgi:hypothetical protein